MSGFTELFYPYSVTTVTIGTSTFALAAATGGDGVQIIDITDPYNPILASVVTDGANGFTELNGSMFVTTVKIGTSTYALVTAVLDSSVQIIDITDPYHPTPASAITDGERWFYRTEWPYDVTTVTIGSSTFALVASTGDDGIQIIDITDLPITTKLSLPMVLMVLQKCAV